jgi:hypothetical protein
VKVSLVLVLFCFGLCEICCGLGVLGLLEPGMMRESKQSVSSSSVFSSRPQSTTIDMKFKVRYCVLFFEK